jgi:chromosome segregation ATPase
MFTVIAGIAVGLGVAFCIIMVLKKKQKLPGSQPTQIPQKKSEQQVFDEHILSLQIQLGKDNAHLTELKNAHKTKRGKLEFNQKKKAGIEEKIQSGDVSSATPEELDRLKKEYGVASNSIQRLEEEISDLQQDIGKLESVISSREDEISRLKGEYDRVRRKEKTLAIQAQAGDADLGTGGPEARNEVLRMIEESKRNSVALNARVTLNSELGASHESDLPDGDSEFDQLMARAKEVRTNEPQRQDNSTKE